MANATPLTSSSLLFSPTTTTTTQPPLTTSNIYANASNSSHSSTAATGSLSNNNGLFVRRSPVPSTTNNTHPSVASSIPITINHAESASTSNYTNTNTAPTSGLSNLFTGYTQNTSNMNASYHELPCEKRQRMTVTSPGSSSNTMGYIPGSVLMNRMNSRSMAIPTGHGHSTIGVPIPQSVSQQQQPVSYVNQR